MFSQPSLSIVARKLQCWSYMYNHQFFQSLQSMQNKRVKTVVLLATIVFIFVVIILTS